MTDGIIARPNHNPIRLQPGRALAESGAHSAPPAAGDSMCARFPMAIALPAHSKANAAKSPDHNSDCAAVENAGSTAKGYETSANSEPRFDSEYSRYGDCPA